MGGPAHPIHARSAGQARAGVVRRSALVALVAVASMIAAACGAGAGDDDTTPAEGAASADSLTILEWAGYELEEFYPGFAEKHPGTTLDFQFGDSDADFLTKVQAGGANPDIVHPCSGWVQQWQDAGLAQPIDVERLSHFDALDGNMRDLGKIDGDYYFVPWDWGYTSLLVATDRVGRVPDSWRDLWDPEYRGRIAFWNDAEEGVLTAAYAWGLDPYNLSEDDMEVLREKLVELNEQTKTYWEVPTELNQLMIDGEVDLAQGWNETYAAMLDAGLNAEYIDPEEGRLGWVCGYVVTAEPGTAAYDAAHVYIDAALSPEAGAFLVDEYYYGHSNLETLEAADSEVVSLIELDRTDIRDRTHFFQPIDNDLRELWSRMWTETTAG